MNILWDFDGTLFNTYPAYTKILQQALGNRVSEEEVKSKLKVSFDHAFQFFGLTEKQEREVRRQVRELKPEGFLPFPHLIEVLDKANKNVIMTHKEREDVLTIIKFHRLERYFADMVAGDDGYPRKPHAASYDFLHRKHQIDLVIGDRKIDILPAMELGIKTCLFQNDSAGADFYLQDYSQFDRKVGIFFGKSKRS